MISQKEGRAPVKVTRPSALSRTDEGIVTPTDERTQEPRVAAPITELPFKPGAGWAQCPSCRYVFTTVANFDRHRRNRGCLDPASVELVINSKGMWSRPQRAEFDCGVDVEGPNGVQDDAKIERCINAAISTGEERSSRGSE